MAEVDQLEAACADAWPAQVDIALGQWRLRAAGGFTGRANSALTIGDPGLPIPAALAATVTFAQDNGIPPTAHVVVGSAVETDVTDAGWGVHHGHPGGAESVVLTAGTGDLGHDVPEGVTVLAQPPADWWPLAVGADTPTPAQRQVLAGRPGIGFGTAVDGDQVVGIVRGVVVGDLLHIARLAVAASHRRRGLAMGLLAALGRWGRQRGAGRYVLQVATGNHGALSLYDRLGARQHHRYRYWVPSH